MRIVFNLSNLDNAASYLAKEFLDSFSDTSAAKEYTYSCARAEKLQHKHKPIQEWHPHLQTANGRTI